MTLFYKLSIQRRCSQDAVLRDRLSEVSADVESLTLRASNTYTFLSGSLRSVPAK